MKNKIKKVVIWGGWYGSRNIGDRLLLITIAEMLETILGPYELTILSANPRLVSEYFYNEKLAKVSIVKPKSQVKKLMNELINCDLFIFGGGLPFFDDFKQALMMTLLTSVLLLFQKPYFTWCVSSYKIKKPVTRFLYRRILLKAKKITCRDRYSRGYFLDLSPKLDPVIVQDSAFTLDSFDFQSAKELINKYIPLSQQESLFALTPRTLRTKRSEAQTHYNEKSEEEIHHQIRVYSIAINWLLEHGYTPVFIPMNTNPPDDDREIGRILIEQSDSKDKVFLIDEMIMPEVAPALYSFFKGSLVSRVHGSITSFLGECPPVMYAFETKHKGVMESMMLENQIFDVTRKPEEIIPLLENVINNRNEILKSIRLSKQDLAGKARVPLNYVAEIL